jgi:predicted dehydrogenase
MVNPQLIVKAVADLEEDRRVFVKTNYPTVTVERDPEAIIDDPDVDAVVIATPVSTHYDLAMRCVESGKHVLVEKPMATQVSQIEDIARVANNNNLVAMVGHTFLFNQAVRYVKDLIDRGELGDIRYIYSQRVNLGRIRNDVDAMWNLAPHDVSIIQYWLGDIEPLSINRIGMDYVQKGINDVVFLNVIYPNDVNMDFDDPSVTQFNHRSGDVVFPQISWKEPLKEEIAHFASCIIHEEKCITDTQHALRVVDILSRT